MKAKKLYFIIIAVTFASGCHKERIENVSPDKRDYRQDMRNFVENIVDYAKSINSNFIIVPQNGQELITDNGKENGNLETAYLDAIDGAGREELFYGFNTDNVPTSDSNRNYMIGFLDLLESNGIEVLVTDYCWDTAFIDSSYKKNASRGYISFAADHRELDDIPVNPPTPYNVNAGDIITLSDAKNFLYIINTSSFPDKESFLNKLKTTNYDLLIIDLFFGNSALTPTEIASLKQKSGGGKRVVISYLSIGEAEDYRYYWNPEWTTNPPSWLAGENPDWPGNYKVRYWEKDWQDIIYGNSNSYMKKILDAGFDGVYLDIIDAFEYFEE